VAAAPEQPPEHSDAEYVATELGESLPELEIEDGVDAAGSMAGGGTPVVDEEAATRLNGVPRGAAGGQPAAE
jgi:hypothetical protein